MGNRHKAIWAAAASVALVGLLTACKSSGGNQVITISGAGSTFINPAMTRWTYEFTQSHPKVHVNYQSIGSGAGIQQIRANTVDFGASDAALTDSQLKEMPPVLQIPESAGPVCITYNLPELKQPLRLSPQALAGIFLGSIKSWRDPIIAKDNPGVSLPDKPVLVSHRSDASGTTSIFTTYLDAVNPEWKQKVGAGTAVSWPTGIGGKGSEGVTANIQNAEGAIGYVELSYAQQNNLPTASIENAAGKYIQPTAEGTTAAIAAYSADLEKDPRTPIVNPPASAPAAYPIAGLTFLIIPKDGPDKAKRTALKQFIEYMITDGQALAGTLSYAPLPESIRNYDEQQLRQMTAAGQAIP
jgi:phosphate transport system substrate-binding protein